MCIPIATKLARRLPNPRHAPFIMPGYNPNYTGLSTRKIAGLYRNTIFCPSWNSMTAAQLPSLFCRQLAKLKAHPNSEKYPNQSILVVALDGYVYLVPCVEEADILAQYEKGELKSTSPKKTDLAKFKAAASATFVKDKRINIRLSSPVFACLRLT